MDDCQTECCWSPLTPVVLHTISGDSATAVPQWATERLHDARTALFCTVLSGQRPSPALLCHSQSSGCVSPAQSSGCITPAQSSGCVTPAQSSGCVTLRAQAVSLSQLRLCHSGSELRLSHSGSELRLCHSQSSGCVTLRAQAVSQSELRSCVKVEVAALSSPYLTVHTVSVDVSQH